MKTEEICEKLEKLSRLKASPRRTDRVVGLMLQADAEGFVLLAERVLERGLLRPSTLRAVTKVRRVFGDVGVRWQFVAVKSLLDEQVEVESSHNAAGDVEEEREGTVCWVRDV